MERKPIKYFLLTVLLGTWGLLGYRLFQRTHSKEPPVPTIGENTARLDTNSKDSFFLLLTYSDPFLSKAERPANVEKPTVARTPPKTLARSPVEKPKAAPVVFPEIIYKGNIRLKSGRFVAVIATGGKTLNLGSGESIDGVTLLKIYDDSIRVKFQKADKSIPRARQ